MWRATMLVAVAFSACVTVKVTVPSEIRSDFDLDRTLTRLDDCDALGDTFVAVVGEAARELDDLAASSGGRVPPGELTTKVDVVTGTSFFRIGGQLGCDAVSQRVDTIERLRRLQPESAAGKDLVEEVIRHLQEESG